MSFNDSLIASVEAAIEGGDNCHQTSLCLASLQKEDSAAIQAAVCSDMGWDLSLIHI